MYPNVLNRLKPLHATFAFYIIAMYRLLLLVFHKEEGVDQKHRKALKSFWGFIVECDSLIEILLNIIQKNDMNTVQ